MIADPHCTLLTIILTRCGRLRLLLGCKSDSGKSKHAGRGELVRLDGSEIGSLHSELSAQSRAVPLSFHDVGLWIGVDKMLAPFRETVKI